MIQDVAVSTQTPEPSAHVDVSAERCPMTWVRTKVALEHIGAGDVLEVTLGAGEMLRNLPKNASEDGHDVRGPEPIGDGRHRMWVRKRETP